MFLLSEVVTNEGHTESAWFSSGCTSHRERWDGATVQRWAGTQNFPKYHITVCAGGTLAWATLNVPNRKKVNLREKTAFFLAIIKIVSLSHK